MTIEKHIKNVMIKCPLTEEQEGALLKGLENYLDEIELVKSCSIPDVVHRRELLKAKQEYYTKGYNDSSNNQPLKLPNE